MELNIIFGWHLDGPSFPEDAAIGRLAVGPVGMLMQLCLRLGLPVVFPARAVRIAEFMSRLRRVDDGAQFYSQSFQTDGWGTAKALLSLRDELVANGWNWNVRDNELPERLAALGDIEASGEGKLHSITDMMIGILSALEAIDSIDIDSISLVEEERTLPAIWQRLFSVLRSKKVLVNQLSIKTMNADDGNKLPATDLDRLAENLLRNSKQQLSGDGTVLILESDDEVQAADYIATLLSTIEEHDERLIVIRGSSTSILDQFLRRRGRPWLGGAGNSTLRGYMQTLPLALEVSWKPFDVTRMIEFLMIPNGPVPPFIAGRFIRALKEEPGIGGGAWRSAWESAAEFADQFEKHRQWLEPQVFDSQEGIPASVVVSICDRVRNHALMRSNTLLNLPLEESEVFIKTAEFADVLADTVKASGMDPIPRPQLSRMIESTMSDGYSPDQAQASIWTPIDHPGQIFQRADCILWWGFTDPKQHAKSHPWTIAEVEYLEKHAVTLESPQSVMVREAKSWRRPITDFSRRIIFVKPRTVAGRAVAPHPFFHEISEAIKASPYEVTSRIFVQAHHIYSNPETTVVEKTLHSILVPNQKLPSPRPTWKISPAAALTRKESATSLERLLGCPLSWLLDFKARLHFGHILSINAGEQLAGIVAHAVFSEIFSNRSWMEDNDLAGRAALHFEDLCPRIASPLLLSGKSLERQRLKRAICEGVEHLGKLILQANFSAVDCEAVLDNTIDGVDFVGRADMVLVHPDNRDFVIDLKWSRRSTYRRREIIEGRAIQLAVYSALLKHGTSHPTDGGYYMISQRQMLSTALEPFPQHTFVDGAPLDETFRQLVKDYRHHMQHLTDGIVYATGLEEPPVVEYDEFNIDIVSDDDPEVFSSRVPGVFLSQEPPCKFCNFGRLCGKRGFDS